MDVHSVEAKRHGTRAWDNIGFIKPPLWTPILGHQRPPLLAMKAHIGFICFAGPWSQGSQSDRATRDHQSASTVVRIQR